MYISIINNINTSFIGSQGGGASGITANVGSPAENRASSSTGARTVISFQNPSDGGGVVTTVDIWAATSMTGVILNKIILQYLLKLFLRLFLS